MSRRTLHDPLQPLPQATWLVVRNKHRQPLESCEIAPGADLRAVLMTARSERMAAGVESENDTGCRSTEGRCSGHSIIESKLMQQTREIRREDAFAATGDDGKQYTVTEFREYLTTTRLDGTRDSTAGMQIFKSNGQHVNRIDPENYLIVGTGVKLRKNPH
jgi:hypothetical protein